MKLRFFLSFAILLTCFWPTLAQKPGWLQKMEKITLMESVRSDVEKNFGHPENSAYEYHRVYLINEGRLSAEYSRGLCSEKNGEGWNVPEFTVTRLFFFPKRKLKLKLENLGLDFTYFRKSFSDDVPGAYGYGNEDLGIDIDVTSGGIVESIMFYPVKKYDVLFCK